MALTPTLVERWHDTKRVHGVATIVASGNYTTGGEAPATVLTALFKISRDPYWVEIVGKAGYIYTWDFTNKKIMVFYGDNNNATDGPLIEIPAAAYPAGVTGDSIRLYCIGKL